MQFIDFGYLITILNLEKLISLIVSMLDRLIQYKWCYAFVN